MHTYILHTYIRTYIHTKFQTGGDVPSVFKRFCNLSEVVENAAKKHNTKIMWNEKLGFLGTCPSNIGTGLRASVMAELPNFRALKGYGIRFIYYSMCVCKSVSLALYVCMHVCVCMYVCILSLRKLILCHSDHTCFQPSVRRTDCNPRHRCNEEKRKVVIIKYTDTYIHACVVIVQLSKHIIGDDQRYDISNTHRVGFTEVKYTNIYITHIHIHTYI